MMGGTEAPPPRSVQINDGDPTAIHVVTAIETGSRAEKRDLEKRREGFRQPLAPWQDGVC